MKPLMNTDEHRTESKYQRSNIKDQRPKVLFAFCSLLFALCSGLLCTLTMTANCRRASSSAPLQIGIIAPSLDWLPLEVARDAGALAGQKLQYARFNSGWELGEALVAGRVDVAILPFTYVISAAAQGSPVRIVAHLEHEDDGIIARPGITRLEELAGRRVGCLKSSTIELFLRQALDRRGIKSELVYFASPMEMWAALEQGAVDALSAYVPGIIRADGKIGNVIYWYSADSPMHPCCDVAIHQTRTQAKMPAVRKLLAGLTRGAELIARDTLRAVAVAAKTYDLPDSIALLSLRRTPFRVSLTKEESDFELATARQMKELGYIARDITARELFRTDLLKP
jgi:ABC-type nitrate/sulfonate/bicarbonate transport system substrate-binding protein